MKRWAIEEDKEDAVRLLLDEEMEAVGGVPAMSMAMEVAHLVSKCPWACVGGGQMLTKRTELSTL